MLPFPSESRSGPNAAEEAAHVVGKHVIETLLLCTLADEGDTPLVHVCVVVREIDEEVFAPVEGLEV